MTLNDTGNRLPFSVPESYFEEFAMKIEGLTTHPVISSRKIFKPWIYAAAVFAGLVVISTTFYTVHNKNIAKNSENYELYMVSQADESLVYDNYINEMSDSDAPKTHKSISK